MDPSWLITISNLLEPGVFFFPLFPILFEYNGAPKLALNLHAKNGRGRRLSKKC